MQVRPYDRPRPRGFGVRFVRRTLAARHAIERSVSSDRSFHRALHEHWVRFDARRPLPEGGWRPKVYVCVTPTRYWEAVRRLVAASHELDVHWKFYMGPDGYDRPDKIVLYARSPDEMRALLPRLARLLRGLRGHEMHHACSPAELRMPAAGEILHLGCDPSFLRTSWRAYRCFVVAWAEHNRAYLAERRGGLGRWLHEMNVSADHEGPVSLRPRGSIAFVRSQWELIRPAPAASRAPGPQRAGRRVQPATS